MGIYATDAVVEYAMKALESFAVPDKSVRLRELAERINRVADALDAEDWWDDLDDDADQRACADEGLEA